MCYLKYKLIEKIPEGKTISNTDSFRLQLGFSTPHKRVTLPTPQYEETFSKEKVQEDRGMAIEAAIVRVMKTRKALEFNELQQEVFNLLKQFTPDPKQIKQKIEYLLEKDFLERDQTNKHLLKYVA